MASSAIDTKIGQAIDIIRQFGLPRAQQNDRSALCLLALLGVAPTTSWEDARDPLMGITPIMDWVRENYDREYAPNTRETFRRQTMHQFVQAGIALYNPDNATRPVNSPKAVYQIEPAALMVIRRYGTPAWSEHLYEFAAQMQSLVAKYARDRAQVLVPIKTLAGQVLTLSPGKHSELIKAILEEFAPRFVPGAILLYVGDTGDKLGYFDRSALEGIGVRVDSHGKMPDVVLLDSERDWLVLIESVTSHGPVDGKRHEELARLFSTAKPGLVYVTAFPDRSTMGRYLSQIAWETEVWVADAPSHLIHFNGERFLGPYDAP